VRRYYDNTGAEYGKKMELFMNDFKFLNVKKEKLKI